MRARAVFWAVGLSLLVAGCSTIGPGIDTLAYRIKASINDCQEKSRNRRWADDTWKRIANSSPTPFSEDYAAGFRDGFSCYLYTGWPDVPPLPPRHYRAVKYQTPAGYRAIEDWFAGYRFGVSVAQRDGYREWITGPSSLRPPGPPGPPPGPGCPPPELVKATPARPVPVKAPEIAVAARQVSPAPLRAPSAQRVAAPPVEWTNHPPVPPVVRHQPPPPRQPPPATPGPPPGGVPPRREQGSGPNAQQAATDGRRGLIIRLGFNWPW
jgi:hypothetical protein